jgi:hypothetical protein
MPARDWRCGGMWIFNTEDAEFTEREPKSGSLASFGMTD